MSRFQCAEPQFFFQHKIKWHISGTTNVIQKSVFLDFCNKLIADTVFIYVKTLEYGKKQ